MRNPRRRKRGFSLAELLIALAAAALLCAVAYPSYTAQVRKARRAECRGALLQTLQLQERLYTQQGTYAAFAAGAADAPMPAHSGPSPEAASCLIEAAECEAGYADDPPTLAQCVEVRGTLRGDTAVTMLYLTSGNVRGCTRADGTRGAHAGCWN